MSAPADAIGAGTPRPRPFLWSVRRELWEHRAVYLAPAAVTAVALTAFVFASWHIPHAVRSAVATGKDANLNMPYAAAAAASFMTGFLVAVFYCLAAFNGERRDRSLLFWKSLPVSDATAVMAKATVPLAVQPVVCLVVAVVAHLFMLVWSTAVLLLNGMDPGLLWSRVDLPMLWAMLPYGLLVNALWDAPVYGWLLLVSASVKRAAFVWAIAPWPALALFEFLAFRTQHVRALLDSRIFGGFALAFTKDGKGKAPIESLGQVDATLWLAHPGLWGGLLFAALCLAACVWLRRRHDPL